MEVPTLAQLALTPGGGMVFVDEVQSWYRTATGPLVADGFVVVANVSGTFWIHQGPDMTLSPLGLGTDDWPRVPNAANACAAFGKRVLLTEEDFTCLSTTVPLVSNVHLEAMGRGTRILVNLVGVLPTVAPFRAGLGAQGAITTISAVQRGAFSVVTAVATGLAIGTIIQIANPLTAGNSAGFQVSTHKVAAIAGVNVNLLPDIPRDYPANSTFSDFASRPQNIRLIGNGATITGLSVRYFELAAALDCLVDGWRFSDEGGAIATDLCLSFDGGGSSNKARRIKSRITGPSTPLACCALESNDSASCISEFDIQGGMSYGVIFYDCADCIVRDGSASHCPAVACVAFVADTAVHSASTLGCISCHVLNVVGFNSPAGVLLRDGARDCTVECSAFSGCTIGISLGGIGGDSSQPTGNTISNTATRENITHGIVIGTGCVGTRLDKIDVSGNGVSAATGTGVLNQGTGTGIARLFSAGGNNINLILSSFGASLTDLVASASPTPAINGWVQCNGGLGERYALCRATLTLAGGAANSSVVQTNAVLSVQQSTLAANGGASTGILFQATGMLRVGRDNSFVGCATGYGPNGVGGAVSQNQVTLGAAPVAVAFADLKVEDRILCELQALGGTGAGGEPIITRTPGTGFTVTRPIAGDTSIWNTAIES